MTQKYQVKVSMKQAAIVETGIVLKQGDFGMQIEIEVLDFDATGTTPQIVFRKAMGAVESTTITVSGNKYTYTFKGTELDTPGKCFCDLKLKNSTTQRISTASFMFKVVADTLDGLAEEASSYSDTIEQIVAGFDDEINEIKNTTQKMFRAYTDKSIFVVNALNGATGQISGSTIRICTPNYIPDDIEYIKPNTGFFYIIFAYNKETNAYIGQWNGTSFAPNEGIWILESFDIYSLPTTYRYKIMAGATNNREVTIDDAENILFYSQTDNTLSIKGFPADSAVVGNKFNQINLSISELNGGVEDLKTITKKLFSSYINKSIFVVNALNGATGQISGSTIRICTPNYLSDDIRYVEPKTGFFIMVFAYNRETDAYIGQWTGSSFEPNAGIWILKSFDIDSLPKTNRYKIMAGATNNREVTIDDAENILFHEQTDKSLSVEGFPADAATTGANINQIKKVLNNEIEQKSKGNYIDYGSGKIDNKTLSIINGAIVDSTTDAISNYIQGLVPGKTYKFFGLGGIKIGFYDALLNYISGASVANYGTFTCPNNTNYFIFSCQKQCFDRAAIIESSNYDRRRRELVFNGEELSNNYRDNCKKGVNIYITGNQTEEELKAAIDSGVADGINAIAIMVTPFMTSATANTFNPISSTILNIFTAICQYCIEIGLKVMVRLSPYGNNIDPHPSDIAEWFINYRAWIEVLMDEVYPKGVREVHVLNECRYIQNNADTTTPLASFLTALRSDYPNVAWGVDFNGYDKQRLHLGDFDVIGFNIYPEITRESAVTDDLIIKRGFYYDLMSVNYVKILDDLIDKYPDKNIEITEIGVQSESKGLYQTWAVGYNPSSPNQYVQEAYYKALMEVFYIGAIRLKGIYLFELMTTVNRDGDGFDFLGKRAENIVKYFWKGDN